MTHDFAARIGADGVHLAADTTLYAEARKTLGARRVSASFAALAVTMPCAWPRRARITSLSARPDGDSDAIDQCAELIAWWSEIFVVPCIAWNVGNAEEAARCAARGADFVAPPLASGAMTRPRLIAEIDRAIRASRRTA